MAFHRAGHAVRRAGRAALAVALAGAAWPAAAPAEIPLAARRATAARGMVVAAHPRAAEAGVEIFKAGGNAFDAAAATAFAVGVAEPFGSGIGGDGMALIHVAATSQTSAQTSAIDFRSLSPAAATPETYDLKDAAKKTWRATAKAAAVPGVVAGVLAMHAEYGRLPRAAVMAPAIRLAEEGFAVEAAYRDVAENALTRLRANPAAAAVYLHAGQPPAEGHIVKNRELADTLRRISAEGPDGFYKGPVAAKITAGLAAGGAVMTEADLAGYRPRVRKVLTVDYRGFRVSSAPPPFGGLMVLQNLKTIERLPVDFKRPQTDPANLNWIMEAMKRSSGESDKVNGDPDFARVPTEQLLSDAQAAGAATAIMTHETSVARTAATAAMAAAAGDGDETVDPKTPGQTTHLSVIDAEGNAVSLTQTLGVHFGCFQMPAGTGVLMNAEMINFSPKRASPNALAPRKRVRSTQSPTLVTRDGEVVLAVGSPGDYYIVTAVTNVLLNHLAYGMDLFDAVDAPRFAARYNWSMARVEKRLPAATLAALDKLGEPTSLYEAYDLHFGGVAAISRDPVSGRLYGVADRRRDGVAKGF